MLLGNKQFLILILKAEAKNALIENMRPSEGYIDLPITLSNTEDNRCHSLPVVAKEDFWH